MDALGTVASFGSSVLAVSKRLAYSMLRLVALFAERLEGQCTEDDFGVLREQHTAFARCMLLDVCELDSAVSCAR